jgi:hypothetical protein
VDLAVIPANWLAATPFAAERAERSSGRRMSEDENYSKDCMPIPALYYLSFKTDG